MATSCWPEAERREPRETRHRQPGRRRVPFCRLMSVGSLRRTPPATQRAPPGHAQRGDAALARRGADDSACELRPGRCRWDARSNQLPLPASGLRGWRAGRAGVDRRGLCVYCV